LKHSTFACALLCLTLMSTAFAQDQLPAKFALPRSGLELERRTQLGSFFDVAGRRSVIVGYENRATEAWVYPLKIADDFSLSFKLEGYPLEFPGEELQSRINVRPEATTFTYSHAAFTVRQTIFAPVDEPGIVMLLDVDSVLPIQIIGSFRPKLSLMWPAGLMTNNVDYAKSERAYYLIEESNRYVGVIGSPVMKDVSVQPYQEEPRDAPTRFVIDVPAETLKKHFIPVVIAGSIEGRAKAREAYRRMLGSVKEFYESNVAHYKRLNEETLTVTTPDERLNKAFAWAKVGVEKGIATNPLLGTGLVAGFRTSGNSERPGFAWYFGRDALWTSFAINSYGDFNSTKTALEFLKKFQRADGKIPHEVSQSASLIRWFDDYPYAWASADATPLYIVAHADYLRASGDKELIRSHWDSIVKAYRFTLSTDTDGNGLIENTQVGHGWVEGGRLYPPHEEIYQQGVWVEALRSLAEMADALGTDAALAAEARRQAERVREQVENIYWMEAQKIYAFSTNLPRAEMTDEERDEQNPATKARMRQLREAKLIDEVTVLPAVPMWWRVLDEGRADQMLDRIGSSEISTDWGARIVSNQSQIYDPLSYHYGSVWPLFTGWAAMAAYKYHRPHVGYDFLMSNALLTYDNALGYVTELLSGDFNQAFGRSSHHQIWSCAMVVTPLVRGMLGLEADAVNNRITFAPQVPADWGYAMVDNYRLGAEKWDIDFVKMSRTFKNELLDNQEEVSVVISPPKGSQRRTGTTPPEFRLELPLPLDAQVQKVTRSVVVPETGNVIVHPSKNPAKYEVIRRPNGLICRVTERAPVHLVVTYKPGTEVFVERQAAAVGERSSSLKILSAMPSERALNVTVDGLSGQVYELRVRSHKPILKAVGAELTPEAGGAKLRVTMPRGEGSGYVRQNITVELGAAK
jgi:glycogen debranching enzyme